MSEVNGAPIRFGGYEVDLAAGELHKGGRRIPLQEQPFQILAALLERPGEVVTREYLRERLWPGQPFVDFDQGLNTAINKLRDALGDSASNPRFVETVPRRGYRFTFPVEAPDQAVAPAAAQTGSRSRWWVAAVGLAMAMGGALLWLRHPAQPQLHLRRFALRTRIATEGTNPCNRFTAISPDGRHIAFINDEGRLRIQHLDREQPTAVESGEGVIIDPFWSPDSKVVGFASPFRNVLMRVPVEGGAPTRICEIGGFFSGAAWSPDGKTIVFGEGGPGLLHEVAATGGTPTVLISRDFLKRSFSDLVAGFEFLHSPHFLPSNSGWRVVVFGYGWANAQLLLTSLDGGQTEVLGPGRLPVYSPTGHLIFQSTTGLQELWAQPFSLDQLKKTGPAFRIASNGSDPSVSMDGTLVYVDPASDRLAWVNRQGQRIGLTGPPLLGIFYPAISPDGKRVAVEARETENLDVWVHDLARGTRTRLSSDPATEILPVWSPDGEQVAYSSWRAGNTDIYLRKADASAEEKLLVATPGHERVSDWSRDGEYILYSREDPKASSDLWYLKRTAAGGWEPHAFLATRHRERVPKFSPDGKYVAYLSDESGRDELYVRPFPRGDRQWAVSRDGASQPRWSRNGREIFYLEPGAMMAVAVRTTPDFSADTPVRLFSHAGFGNWWDPNYDVSSDGQRFLLPERVSGPGSERLIHVVQNWFAEFRGKR